MFICCWLVIITQHVLLLLFYDLPLKQALADGLGASQEQLCRLSLNAVEASWLSLADKVRLTRDIRLHAALHGVSLH